MWKNIVGGRGNRPQIKIWHMRISCWVPNVTNIHVGCVIFIAFPQQQRFHERAPILHYTYIACLVYLFTALFPYPFFSLYSGIVRSFCVCFTVMWMFQRACHQISFITHEFGILCIEYMSTLTEVFPCFSLTCKANARVKPSKMGHGPHSS
jgi:hypothetical protein